MRFKEGKVYEVTRTDVGRHDRNRKYKARFYHMTDNLIIFDKGLYKVSEIKKNYRKTWKVRIV